MAGATALAMSFGWPGYLADRVSIYINININKNDFDKHYNDAFTKWHYFA